MTRAAMLLFICWKLRVVRNVLAHVPLFTVL